MSDAVVVEVAGPVARITLNAPDRLNALDEPMLDDLTKAVTDLDPRADVRVIGLTGAGRGFCSGANLVLPEPDAASGAEPDAADGGRPVAGDGAGATGRAGDAQADAKAGIPTGTLEAVGRFIRTVSAARTPVVALVNGVAAGVGVSLALVCPYVLASEKASFVVAFGKVGLMPDGGATALVAASVGRARALRMALLGEKVTAATAAEWGLVSETVPAERFEARSAELLDFFAAAAPRALAETVSAVNAATLDIEATLTREETGQYALLHSADFQEGVAAFREKRAPVFKG